MQSSNEILALFTDTCGGVEKERPSHRGDGKYTTQQYQSFKVRENIHIGISRGDYDPDELETIQDAEGKVDYSRLGELTYTRITELHVLNNDGEWAGGSVSIYKPELDYTFGEEMRYHIKPAHVSASSAGLDTTDHARVQAEMLVLAANYADALTEEMRPELEAKADEANAQWAEDRAASAAKAEERQAKIDTLLERFGHEVVRVYTTERKSSIRGPLSKVEGKGYSIVVGDRIVPVGKITKIQTKSGSQWSDVLNTDFVSSF